LKVKANSFSLLDLGPFGTNPPGNLPQLDWSKEITASLERFLNRLTFSEIFLKESEIYFSYSISFSFDEISSVNCFQCDLSEAKENRSLKLLLRHLHPLFIKSPSLKNHIQLLKWLSSFLFAETQKHFCFITANENFSCRFDNGEVNQENWL